MSSLSIIMSFNFEYTSIGLLFFKIFLNFAIWSSPTSNLTIFTSGFTASLILPFVLAEAVSQKLIIFQESVFTQVIRSLHKSPCTGNKSGSDG
jgi:hypothetical protein